LLAVYIFCGNPHRAYIEPMRFIAPRVEPIEPICFIAPYIEPIYFIAPRVEPILRFTRFIYFIYFIIKKHLNKYFLNL
jgi:hypothetical protein